MKQKTVTLFKPILVMTKHKVRSNSDGRKFVDRYTYEYSDTVGNIGRRSFEVPAGQPEPLNKVPATIECIV